MVEKNQAIILPFGSSRRSPAAPALGAVHRTGWPRPLYQPGTGHAAARFNRRVSGRSRQSPSPADGAGAIPSISANNLDEFFMVRVAGLKAQVRAGVIARSLDGTGRLAETAWPHQRCGYPALPSTSRSGGAHCAAKLAAQDVVLVDTDNLKNRIVPGWPHHFLRNIFPVLTPLAVDPAHPVPCSFPILGFSLAPASRPHRRPQADERASSACRRPSGVSSACRRRAMVALPG